MGASVVTGVDAPPVLEPAEHILNFVTLAIELSVMFDWYFPIDFDGMHAAMPRSARAWRNQPRHTPCRRESLARGNAASIEAAPLKSLVWPSLSSMISGRP